MLVGTVYLFKTMPTGFIPSQDSGFLFAITLGPQDISFESMAAHTQARSGRSSGASGSRRRRACSFPQGGLQPGRHSSPT